jgi:CheY-like chemotaxis protein
MKQSRLSPLGLEPQPGHTVLVVEDEVLVRLAVAKYLRGCGFQVLEAASGDEAVTILSADVAVDVVCSHVQMPGDLNGFALARWVRFNRPNVQTLLTSGHIGTVTNAGHRDEDALPPHQPYDYEGIVQHIRRALAQ